MNIVNNIFHKHLAARLPIWQEKGLVTAENSALILKLEHQDKRKTSSIGFLSYLGVFVLGIGILLFFAANWDNMSKITKLIILFSGMWGAYAFGGWLIARNPHHAIGKALILLGTILFGANIMLIAQIYHIDSHYPDGVLIWSLGTLLVALLMRIPIIAAFGLCLAILWSGLESFSFLKIPHGEFLVLWAGFMGLCLKEGWQKTQHLAGIALGIWLLIFIPATLSNRENIYFLLPYFIIFLLLLPGISAIFSYKKIAEYTAVLRIYLMLTSLIILYWIGFDFILRGSLNTALTAQMTTQYPALPFVITILYIFAGAMTGLGSYFFLIHKNNTKYGDRIMITALYLAIVLLGLLTLHKGLEPATLSALYRIAFFFGLVWFAHYGFETGRKSYINIALFFIIILLMTVYFTTLWTLMNRSLVLMGGGAILLGLSFFLNRQRQKYINLMTQEGDSS